MTKLSAQATSDNEEAGVSVSEFNTKAVRNVKYKAIAKYSEVYANNIDRISICVCLKL